ncbi:MDR family MFS transporter [Microbacterium fluvii]|uniref:MDR family MFS transporter n=1 Tax=Microbacterium fluvii TaxID=415215 RepID=A0ABW2HEB5_9MICO|nr:MDR family MFS transporter [Microbacterium fluvii]MCU4673226.1 MFS transporter [Microbacterium fluvii]
MPLSALRLRLLVASLLVVSFLGALDHTVVSTSLATIAGSLGALEQLSWIVVGYTLAATAMLPVLGKLGDVVGPRRVFLISLVGFIAASLVCGFAPSMGWLIAARVVQGMCSAGLQLMSQTIIATVTTPRQRPRYMAIIGAAFPIAIVVGPVLGGLITDFWGWPWVFWINVPVGIAALVLALVAVPHIAPGVRARFDVAGAISFTIALVALVLGVTWVGDASLRLSAAVAFAVALAAFAVFFAIEARAQTPILPLPLFADRTIAACFALSAIIGIGLFAVTSYLPTYFQMAYRTTATVSGLVPIATVLGMLVSNLVTGHLVSRTGRYRLYPIIGTLLGAAGLFVMALLPVGLPLAVPMAVMAVVGIGTGSFMNLIFAVVQSAAPRDQLGTVTATTNLVRQIGATVTTAVIGGVVGFGVAARLPQGLDAATLTPQIVHAADPATQAAVAEIYRDVFVPVFLALAAVYALGVVAAVMLPHGRLSDDTSSIPVTDPQTQTA